MKKFLIVALLLAGLNLSGQEYFKFGTAVNPKGESFLVDSKGFVVGGRRVLPVMGEIHFARVPKSEWKREVLKMKAGGIDIVACYVFWLHHEDHEGVYDWSGNRNLREFLEICKECGEKVVLRVGPFCHGEAYLGGIPEWVIDKALADPANFRVRTLAPGFISAVSDFYKEIGRQAEGLLWKDGGPVVGLQVDNESSGPWPYLATLKQAAIDAGFDLPFYTRTGWPKMIGPAVFGEILPLYGDYPDGFWDRALTDMPGSYRDAFHFRDSRLSAVIATEVFGTDQSTAMEKSDLAYPYLTCELGGGMIPSYHRRIRIFDNDALALSICKVGSGSNLPGYYMYHGGTNPDCEEHPMSELQNSKYTNSNDLPQKTYDYQAPLGEMGQPNPSYHRLRVFHQMLREWGDELSAMDPVFPEQEGSVRVAVRSKDGSGFLFVNNYERMADLPEGKINFCGQSVTVPSGASFCFPIGMKVRRHTVDWATAQPFCKLGRMVCFAAVEGIEPQICVDGDVFTPELDKPFRAGGVRMLVMSPGKALQAYKVSKRKIVYSSGIVYKDGRKLVHEDWVEDGTVSAKPVREAGPARDIRLGRAFTWEQPSEEDFDEAAGWSIPVPVVDDPEDWFLSIDYNGDVARVYADGKFIQDNFWNGQPMMVRVSDLVGKDVTLSILPMRKDTPIYLQKEQKETLASAEGDTMLSLQGIRVIHRITE